MLKNFFKTAFRVLLANKTFFFINILGLSAGLASFILILLFLQNELGYEKHITDSDRIYRLVGVQRPSGIDVQHVAITSGPWTPALRENLPEVEDAVRMMPAMAHIFIVDDDKIFREYDVYYTETSVFGMFDIKLLRGDPSAVLEEPNSAVLSKSMAEKFYGTDDAVGKTFRNNNLLHQVTGIMEDQNNNSHLEYDILISYPTIEEQIPELKNWGSNWLATYVKLKEGATPENTEEGIHMLADQFITDMGLDETVPRPEMYLQPLEDIHLRSGHIRFSIYDNTGDINTVYIFSVIAVLILLIACMNFINLTTAKSTQRIKEVGIRKTLGADRKKLIVQFISEALIVVLIALTISIALIEIFLPEMNNLLDTNMQVSFFSNWIFNIGLLGILIFVGLLAGTYPAFYLSSFQPADVLKNSANDGRSSAGIMRKILVVSQFTVAVFLIFSVYIIFQQVNYIKRSDLGIDYDNVVILPIYENNVSESKIINIKNELKSNPGIKSVTAASNYNGVSGTQGPVTVADTVETELMVRYGFVDEDYFPNMNVPFIEGRNFSSEYRTDQSQAVILNKSAVKALNWDDPIGKRFINRFVDTLDYFTVIGVIDDYNYHSLREPIEPAFYLWRLQNFRTIMVRVNSDDVKQTINFIEEKWSSFFTQSPFVHVFVTDRIQRMYQNEAHSLRIFFYFALLCIIISSLGLYGLTAFVVERKRKEIGIRKIMGSSVFGVIVNLQKEFIKLILIASAIAALPCYYYMQRWLDNYAYRISLTVWDYLIAIVLILIIAISTICYHTQKAAVSNPVDAIKCE